MGLTISAQIAELHGGDLVACSAKGGGAELVLKLPRDPGSGFGGNARTMRKSKPDGGPG